LKIAILGTRGIPNNYGGFEQFAEYLSVGLLERGHEVYVYNSHSHTYQESTWKGVHIIHQLDPEKWIGTAGQFIYDLNCILNSRGKKFDIIIQLGYTSSSVWSFLFPKKAIIATNMDGLEWKRTKYGKSTQRFLMYAEKLAVKKSDYLIADSVGIQNYLLSKYNAASEYIPYGANVFEEPDESVLTAYQLKALQYDLLIARLEPENSLEIVLDGFTQSHSDRKLIVIGNHKTKYGNFLVNKYVDDKRIVFFGSLYDLRIINNLRYFSNLYFHGHTVGGTNPSLLEAMASGALIVANNNEFNASILGEDAYYFTNAAEVKALIERIVKNESEQPKVAANMSKIRATYSWNKIIDSYEKFLSGLRKK
jgi:glycosyltransferase involved in cell wall biosynthesis